VFEPENIEQLLRGWLLHAHKGRDRHDRAARRTDRQRLLIGGLAAVLSAVVGTSVFGALSSDGAVTFPVKALVGTLSIVAAILTGLNGFLNLAERTEKHRVAGVRYKLAIRDIERLLSASVEKLTRDDPAVVSVQHRLDELEETAPVVPERLYQAIEGEWRHRGAEFVGKAAELYPGDLSVSRRSE
jgi:hypothetical protein